MTSFLKMTSSCALACICQHTSRTTQTLASLDPRSFLKSFAVRRVWGPDYLLALSVYSVSNSVCLLILDDVLVDSATVQTHIFSLWSSCVRRPEYLRPNAFYCVHLQLQLAPLYT